MGNNRTRVAEIFKALGDENRINILELLQEGEKCGNDILEDLKITQPTMSHHLSILCDAEIIEQRKEGKKVYYTISRDCKEIIDNLTTKLLTVQRRRKANDDIVIL